MKRKCLNCDLAFEANGRFHRICPKCKKITAYFFAEEDVGIGGR